MTKAITGALVFIGFFALLMWCVYNVMTGCALVNDWAHPDCMTPFDILRGQS